MLRRNCDRALHNQTSLPESAAPLPLLAPKPGAGPQQPCQNLASPEPCGCGKSGCPPHRQLASVTPSLPYCHLQEPRNRRPVLVPVPDLYATGVPNLARVACRIIRMILAQILRLRRASRNPRAPPAAPRHSESCALWRTRAQSHSFPVSPLGFRRL